MLMSSYEKLLHAFSTKPNATLAEPSLFEYRDVQRSLTHGLGERPSSRRANSWICHHLLTT